MSSAIDTKSVNSIRVLAADAIQKANSGHPGLPLGSAPMAYELWANHMNTIRKIQNGKTATVSFCPVDMAPPCYIPCFTSSVTVSQLRI